MALSDAEKRIMARKGARKYDRERLTLNDVLERPGITAAEIPLNRRWFLRVLETKGLIECRGYAWYPKNP